MLLHLLVNKLNIITFVLVFLVSVQNVTLGTTPTEAKCPAQSALKVTTVPPLSRDLTYVVRVNTARLRQRTALPVKLGLYVRKLEVRLLRFFDSNGNTILPTKDIQNFLSKFFETLKYFVYSLLFSYQKRGVFARFLLGRWIPAVRTLQPRLHV